MQWDIVASVATAVSASAVVASVVYGAYQIKLNTKALNASTHHQWIAEQREVNRAFIDNPEICELMEKGNRNFGELTQAECLRLACVFWTAFNLWNFVRNSYSRGLIDLQTHDENSLGLTWYIQNNQVIRKIWPMCRIGYRPEFASFIDTIVERAEKEARTNANAHQEEGAST